MPLLVKKPISILDKKLTVTWGELWKTLGKTVAHAAVGKLDELPADLAEIAGAVGLLEDPGEVAWLLIRRSLDRALRDLLTEHRDLFAGGPPEHEGITSAEARLSISDEVLEIDERFFQNPGELELINRLRDPLAHWLIAHGLPRAAGQAIAERLRSYFVVSLHDEWGRSPAEYAKLREAIDTPFTRAQDLERAWMRYEAHLWRQVNEPMFAEAFGLRSVYVPLRAYWARHDQGERPEKSALVVDGADARPCSRVVVDLARELDAWLDANRRDSRLRVLSGGPGSGKSSFTRMYAAATMTRGRVRALYVPLHLFDPKSDLTTALGDYIRVSRLLPRNPLDVDPGERPRPLLMLFDGLDELAMQGKMAADTASEFVREVERTLDRMNQLTPWLSAVISGRELVVQANASDLRREAQILHLLPYAGDSSAESEPSRGLNQRSKVAARPAVHWEDAEALLNDDQRATWWQKYNIVSGLEQAGIPGELLEGELGDVTRQPLLLYLVALSFARGKLTLGPRTNLNDVYADLIDAIWERAYEGRPFRGIRELKRDQFRRVLEEIGLTAWHDERRTTTVRAINHRFESAALASILKAFEQGAEMGVTRLLAAFYFRQHGERDGERTFEFTHKSFGEYLAACRIVRTMSLLDEDMSDHERNPDRGRNVVAALAEWADICGSAPLDEYYVRFLNREVRRAPLEDVKRWHSRMVEMLTASVTTGMPIERLKERPTTFQEELRRARNADEALFACAAACSDVTGELSNIQWPSSTAAGDWIRRLQGQRSGAKNRVVLESLRRVNFEGCLLDGCDLYGANLEGARLHHCELYYSWLASANLQRVNLESARLIGANLHGARLDNANLDGANLHRAHLEGARLTGSHVRKANLDRAYLDADDVKRMKDEGALVGSRPAGARTRGKRKGASSSKK